MAFTSCVMHLVKGMQFLCQKICIFLLISDQVLETLRYGTLLKFRSQFTNTNRDEVISVWSTLYKTDAIIDAVDFGVFRGVEEMGVSFFNLETPISFRCSIMKEKVSLNNRISCNSCTKS